MLTAIGIYIQNQFISNLPTVAVIECKCISFCFWRSFTVKKTVGVGLIAEIIILILVQLYYITACVLPHVNTLSYQDIYLNLFSFASGKYTFYISLMIFMPNVSLDTKHLINWKSSIDKASPSLNLMSIVKSKLS